MSANRSWLLHLEQDSWQLTDTSATEQSPVEMTFAAEELSDQAVAIEAALSARDYQGEPVIVGLATSWCLTATIDVSSPQMLRKPRVLHYQLEEWIPWSAEEYVSDFVGHRDQALMVAVRHKGLAGLLRALEGLGILVPIVAPTIWLALEDHLLAKDLPATHVLFWQEVQNVDVVVTRAGRPLKWNRLPAQAAEIARVVRLQLLTETVPEVLVRGLSPDLLQALKKETPEVNELENVSQQQAAARCCHRISLGLQEPLLNFRRDELGGQRRFQALSKELGWLKVAAAVMLICLSCGFWLRGTSYEQASGRVHTELAQIYESLFPEKPVPDRIGNAISDEYRRLRGTRAPAGELPRPAAADLVLQRVLTALPEEMRFRMPEIQIDRNRVFLSGEVRSNADADRIAAALRDHDFQVDPPRTQRLAEKGFSVRLNAQAKLAERVEQQ